MTFDKVEKSHDQLLSFEKIETTKTSVKHLTHLE